VLALAGRGVSSSERSQSRPLGSLTRGLGSWVKEKGRHKLAIKKKGSGSWFVVMRRAVRCSSEEIPVASSSKNVTPDPQHMKLEAI